jgi:hypothetical protein
MAGYSISDGTQFEGSPFPKSLETRVIHMCSLVVLTHIFLNKLVCTRVFVTITFIFSLFVMSDIVANVPAMGSEAREPEVPWPVIVYLMGPSLRGPPFRSL